MKYNKIVPILCLSLLTFNSYATDAIKSSFKKLNWNGVEVVYLEDNRFPTYEMMIYFADGALSDGTLPGETEHAFNFIDSGTSKFTQEQILDKFDFLGTEISTNTTHEFTTMSIAGLSKDFNSAMKDVCHVLRDGQYPKAVIKKELDKERSEYQSMASNPQALADRANREISLSGTPYSYPVSGKLKDLDLLTSESLRKKMDNFLNNVKKRVYLTGPKSLLSIEKVLTEDCGFKGNENDFVRKISFRNFTEKRAEIVFVPIPEANQVQVRVGRFLNSDEISERNLDILVNELLGGGFTSKLMREVRVKRGLTYSISSYISSQKDYGRAGIATFTKNETINRLIEVIFDTLENLKSKGITAEELARGKSGLLGSHPFKFESNRAFLGQLLYLDHIGANYDELFDFNARITDFTLAEVNKKTGSVFNPRNQTIFILGDKKLEKMIKKLPKKFGKLQIRDYKEFI